MIYLTDQDEKINAFKKEVIKEMSEFVRESLSGKTQYVKTKDGLKTVRQILNLDKNTSSASSLPSSNASSSVHNINLKPEFNLGLLKKAYERRFKNQPELFDLKFKLVGNQAYYSVKYDVNEIQLKNDQLDESEKARFKNQLKNTIIDQQKIKHAKVAVFGCGGIGSNALIGLSFFGVYNYKLVDYDTISLSNLNEQTLYSNPDVGKLKVYRAAERLVEINPIIQLETSVGNEGLAWFGSTARL